MSERAGPRQELHADEPLHRPRLGLLVVVSIAVVLGIALVGLPREGAVLPAIARQALVVALPQWRTTEPVSEIVYGTRGMDTFGETFLLLAAVVSVVLLCRPREPRRGFIGEERAGEEEQREDDPRPGSDAAERDARTGDEAETDPGRPAPPPDQAPLGTPAPERSREMSVVARTAARVAAPALAVAGVYLVAEGYSPGGGFPAGGVALGVILLLYAGFGDRRLARAVNPRNAEIGELVGALVIIAIVAFGLVLRGSFTANWIHLAPQQTLRSGGVLQAFSVSEFLEVATGLVIVVFSVIGIRRDWVTDEDDESEHDR